MTEPDVTLTDYGLTVLCSWFAWSLARQPTHSPLFRLLWVIFFASIAAASFTGGTVHGFFLDESTWGHRFLWPATALAIGVTAASAWGLAGMLFTKPPQLRKWMLFAAALFFLYAAVVLLYSQRFIVVIAHYLPAMIALLTANLRVYLNTGSRAFLLATSGIVVSFVAAFIQQAGFGIHPDHFNHNATYHVVQAVGLCLLFMGAGGLLRTERTFQ